MSFYGNVVYEFTKMFSKILVKRVSSSSEFLAAPQKNEDEFAATDMWEQVEFTPGNRWIQLDGSKDANNKKIIAFAHTAPDSKENKKDVAKGFYREGEDKILKSGDTFTSAEIAYDKAGHVIEHTNVTYTLPEVKIDTKVNATGLTNKVKPDDTNDVLTLNFNTGSNDKWINLALNTDGSGGVTVSHAGSLSGSELTSEEYDVCGTFDRLHPDKDDNKYATKDAYLDAMVSEDSKTEAEKAAMEEYLGAAEINNIYALAPGDLIKTSEIKIDKAGHSFSIEPKYFKLPVTATEQTFENHTNRIKFLEDILDGEVYDQNEFSEYEVLVSEVKDTNGFLEGIKVNGEGAPYEKLSNLTGQLNNMYSTTDEDDKLKFKKSLAETIGKVDGAESIRSAIRTLLNKQDNDEPETCYTISEAVQILVSQLTQNKGQIVTLSLANSALVDDIDDLKAKVEALEGRIAALESPQTE